MQQPALKKRESKRQQKNDSETNAKLLETYNDLKSIFESKELPSRQVYLRRIGLGLVKTMPDIYRFPILQYIEETSKIMLINEFELLYWFHFMTFYLQEVRDKTTFNAEVIKLFFF